MRNYSTSSETATTTPPAAAPPLSSPSKPSWFRRGSDSSNPRSPPPRAPLAVAPVHAHAGDEISPGRVLYSSSPQTSEVGQPLNLSRETNPRSASPSDYEDDDMPPAPAPARFYPKPSLDPPLTDLPPPVMPPPMRANKPFMDPDEAAAERSRRADEHRIKMRERKETQKVEALMQRQEQRMSRRSAKKPTTFVASGADVPPVPTMPVRDSLVVPPTQHEVDEQGRRSTLERNIDSLIAENSVDGDASESGSIANRSARSAQGVSQPPSYPALDALGAPLQAREASPNAGLDSRNENRLSAAISLKRGDGRVSSFYSAADVEGSSPLDSAFGLGPTTPVSATRPTSSFLSPSDAVQPRTVRREHSGSSLRARSVAESQTNLLPDDGKSRDATELFKYEEQLGPAKRVSVPPTSQRNTRTVSILKYTDHPSQGEPILIQKEVSPAGSVLTAAEEERQMDASLFDGDDEFLAFEDLTLTRRLAHLCIIFPYAILGVLVVRLPLDSIALHPSG
jgi:hypothetical protein